MAQLGKRFDPTENDTTQQDFSNVPDGIYLLQIIESDVKPDGDNEAVTTQYEVIEPVEYEKRRIFGWFDVTNDDPEKQERGNRDFSKLCRAIGYDRDAEGELENTDQLHLRPFTAKVKDAPAGVSKAGKPYKAKNQIVLYYYPDEGNAPEPVITGTVAKPSPANDNRPAARPAAAAASAAPARTGARPWGKSAA